MGLEWGQNTRNTLALNRSTGTSDCGPYPSWSLMIGKYDAPGPQPSVPMAKPKLYGERTSVLIKKKPERYGD